MANSQYKSVLEFIKSTIDYIFTLEKNKVLKPKIQNKISDGKILNDKKKK